MTVDVEVSFSHSSTAKLLISQTFTSHSNDLSKNCWDSREYVESFVDTYEAQIGYEQRQSVQAEITGVDDSQGLLRVMVGGPVLIPSQAGDLYKVITLDPKSDLEDGQYLSMANFTIGL